MEELAASAAISGAGAGGGATTAVAIGAAATGGGAGAIGGDVTTTIGAALAFDSLAWRPGTSRTMTRSGRITIAAAIAANEER